MNQGKFQTILGVESSCDETACCIITNDHNCVKILSNIVTSSASLQAKFGGIIPEQAARQQLLTIIPVIKQALTEAGKTLVGIDALAVTFGPGLIGSLLVGVETVKTLTLVWDKPLIPINHLIAHFYANWVCQQISTAVPSFPCLGLLVSGGHTDLVLFNNHKNYQYLGGTRDDAAGECFDKCARILNLPYPGGPAIAKLAKKGNPKAFHLPRPMIGSQDFDFSFSGLKTAVANLVETLPQPLEENSLANLAASIQEAIVDTLVIKTIRAAQEYNIEQIMVAGGVAANQRLRLKLEKAVFQKIPRAKLFFPPPFLCTDNAAMVAAAAFYNPQTINPLDLQASPGLSF